MSFEDVLSNHAAQIQDTLFELLEEVPDSQVRDGMVHALSGGKRLRGFFAIESAIVCGASKSDAMLAACAIEALHAYSLVHDDLPCMDDDDLRRGQPTVHKKWDEATAVLVGDALQTFAFEALARPGMQTSQQVELIRSLAHASGAAGMVQGQAMDIAAETAADPLTLDEITALQNRKTGALIEWSALVGPRLVAQDESAMKRYATALGLAFQIADDILDETGDETKAGKRLKKDADAGKATFVSLLGLSEAQDRARSLVADAIDALSLYDARADHLRDAARFVISREH